jgi:tRNA-specific 2-thiouridylase
MRCLALLSGGLDAMLAVRLMQQQAIDVNAIHFATPLANFAGDAAAAANTLGIPLTIVEMGEAYAEFLRRPRFGYLRGAAPCLDCRIAMLAMARERMPQLDTSFLVTGEVVGQRVKGAVRDLEMMAIHAGCEGWLVRPLCAQLLPPTGPEIRGWIDRAQLLGFQGKSRRQQLALAKELGIDAVPPPRPDCPLLAEPLAARMLQLVRSKVPLAPWLLELISMGRYLQLDEGACLLMGRNQEENDKLLAVPSANAAVEAAIIEPLGFTGPLALVLGELSDANLQRAAQHVARYSRNLPAEPRMLATTGGSAREIAIDTSDL